MGKEHSKLKPRDLAELCKTTAFSEPEIKAYYKEFRKKSLSGKMNVEQFKNMYSDFFPDGDPSAFAGHTFRVFDKNGDGSLDFQELIISMSVMKCGEFDEKLQWAFSMYDVDGNGFITKDELLGILTAIEKMSGITSSDDEESVAEEMADQIFKNIDKNADGKISLEEFIEGAQNDKDLVEMLGNT